MGAGKKIAAGVILAGGGLVLQRIGRVIFSATGTAEGPVVDYGTLMGMASAVLIAIGGLVTLYGVLEGAYRLWARDASDEEGSEPTSSRSRTGPSSQRDRPRNRRRS